MVISRDQVHTLAEACSDNPDSFRGIATRLLKDQKTITNFLNKNLRHLDPATREVVLYMFSVCIRVIDQSGGQIKRATTSQIDAAAARVNGYVGKCLPFDGDFPSRVRTVDARAQEHLLDEVLWALFEREEKTEEEVDVPHEQAGLMFLLLWVAVEVLNENWTPGV